MGILHEISKREHERDELERYLAFYNVTTKKRESKERRLHELDNELRVLRRTEGNYRRDKV